MTMLVVVQLDGETHNQRRGTQVRGTRKFRSPGVRLRFQEDRGAVKWHRRVLTN